jgi:DNA polymerase III subunit epsilon
MGLLHKETFICFDCETTGLDTENDRIIELAAARFTCDEVLETFTTLINPHCHIPKESTEIHHITDDMVHGKPTIDAFLPKLAKFIGNSVVMGHGIPFDIAMVSQESKRHNLSLPFDRIRFFDTLRLARLYGQSPTNSLQMLCKHFNIKYEDAHRALNDVLANIEVFKRLTTNYKTTERVFDVLSRPIELKNMPLGKHKGRSFREIPQEYLQWISNKDFDEDLLFSVNCELRRRKKGGMFSQASNPFLSL